MLGVWSDATDGYDEYWDSLIYPGPDGYAAVYHEQSDSWKGPTGYYRTDRRKVMQANEGKTFAPIALWATDRYAPEIMGLAFEGDPANPPPEDRRYFLELLYVPEGLEGAPEAGTVWEVPYRGLFSILVPTYRWMDDGPGPSGQPHGYLFSFRVTPVIPEPRGWLGALLTAGGLAAARRRK